MPLRGVVKYTLISLTSTTPYDSLSSKGGRQDQAIVFIYFTLFLQDFSFYLSDVPSLIAVI